MKNKFIVLFLPIIVPPFASDIPPQLKPTIITNKKFNANDLRRADFEKMQVGEKVLYEGNIIEKTAGGKYKLQNEKGKIINIRTNNPIDMSWEALFEMEGRVREPTYNTKWAPVNDAMENLEVKIQLLKRKF